MYSKKRPASIARPRQIAMYLAKELTQKSLPEIGELFGGRDHTTVLHAVRKIGGERSKNTELNQQLHVLEQTLKGLSVLERCQATSLGTSFEQAGRHPQASADSASCSVAAARQRPPRPTGLRDAKSVMRQAKIAFSTVGVLRLLQRPSSRGRHDRLESSAGEAARRIAGGGRHRRAPAHAADPGQRADAQERRRRSSSPPATWRSRCAPRPSSVATAAASRTTVGARKLIDILRTLPADQVVTLSSAQNKLTLQGGKSRFTLQTLPADDFPLVNEAADFGPAFSVPQKTLKRPDQPGALRDGGARHPLLPERHPVRRRRQDADPGGHRRPPPGAGAGAARSPTSPSRR